MSYRQHRLLLSHINNISVLRTNTFILIILNKDKRRAHQTKSSTGFKASMNFLTVFLKIPDLLKMPLLSLFPHAVLDLAETLTQHSSSKSDFSDNSNAQYYIHYSILLCQDKTYFFF